MKPFTILDDYPEVIHKLSSKNETGYLTKVRLSFDDKVIRTCEHNHEYAQRFSRVVEGGCGYCHGALFKTGYTDAITIEPKILTLVRDETSIQTLRENTVASSKIVKVRLGCGHDNEWRIVRAVAVTRGEKKPSCDFCSNRKILSGFNDIATVLKFYMDEWAEENTVNPKERLFTSRASVLWRCSKNHLWEKSPWERFCGDKCYFCSNQRILPGYNDLATRHPEILTLWDYVKNKISPDQIMPGSDTKIWLRCERNDCSYLIKAYDAKAGKRCGSCRYERIEESRKKNSQGAPRSRIEEQFVKDFMDYFPNLVVKRDDRLVLKPRELDLWLKDHRVGIEFNGEYWHNEKRAKRVREGHDEKERLAIANDVKLIIVWEKDWREEPDRVLSDLKRFLENSPITKKYTYDARERHKWSK